MSVEVFGKGWREDRSVTAWRLHTVCVLGLCVAGGFGCLILRLGV